MTPALRLISRLFTAGTLAALVVEAVLQIMFLYNFGLAANPILFFNPYCDQEFWERNIRSSKFNDEGLLPHPILSFQRADNVAGKNRFPQLSKQNVDPSLPNGDVIVYGSSFTGHPLFRVLLNKKIPNTNLSVPSYGLDQIYASYELSKHSYKGKTIVIGFLLEDLDRSIFSFREYPKLKYHETKNSSKKGEVYRLELPSEASKNNNSSFQVYSVRLLSNLFSMGRQRMVPKNNQCKLEEKKRLFDYFMKNIVVYSRDLGQKLVFITFNFKEDSDKQLHNWREEFVNDYFTSLVKNDPTGRIEYINTKKLLNEEAEKKKYSIDQLYNPADRHYSKLAFSIVVEELIKTATLERKLSR
jgi:hypothetical protein